MKISKKTILVLICLLILLVVGFLLFGMIGVRTILIMLLLFFAPTYIILNRFDLEEDERIFFSFFIGLGLFPLMVWYVSRIISSLKISLIVTFVLLIVIGLILNIKKR